MNMTLEFKFQILRLPSETLGMGQCMCFSRQAQLVILVQDQVLWTTDLKQGKDVIYFIWIM